MSLKHRRSLSGRWPVLNGLPGLMPGAGHLVHMPAHIYLRLGKYHEAAEGNAHAVHVDKEYLAAGR